MIPVQHLGWRRLKNPLGDFYFGFVFLVVQEVIMILVFFQEKKKVLEIGTAEVFANCSNTNCPGNLESKASYSLSAWVVHYVLVCLV